MVSSKEIKEFDDFTVNNIPVGKYNKGTLYYNVKQAPRSPLNSSYVPANNIKLYVSPDSISITPHENAKQMSFLNVSQVVAFSKAYYAGDTDLQEKIMNVQPYQAKTQASIFTKMGNDLISLSDWNKQAKDIRKLAMTAQMEQDPWSKRVLGSVRDFKLKVINSPQNFGGKTLEDIANDFENNGIFRGQPLPKTLASVKLNLPSKAKQAIIQKQSQENNKKKQELGPAPTIESEGKWHSTPGWQSKSDWQMRSTQKSNSALVPIVVDGITVGLQNGDDLYVDKRAAPDSPFSRSYVSDQKFKLYFYNKKMSVIPDKNARVYNFCSSDQVDAFGCAHMAHNDTALRSIYETSPDYAKENPRIFSARAKQVYYPGAWNIAQRSKWSQLGIEAKLVGDSFARKVAEKVQGLHLVNRYSRYQTNMLNMAMENIKQKDLFSKVKTKEMELQDAINSINEKMPRNTQENIKQNAVIQQPDLTREDPVEASKPINDNRMALETAVSIKNKQSQAKQQQSAPVNDLEQAIAKIKEHANDKEVQDLVSSIVDKSQAKTDSKPYKAKNGKTYKSKASAERAKKTSARMKKYWDRIHELQEKAENTDTSLQDAQNKVDGDNTLQDTAEPSVSDDNNKTDNEQLSM